MATLATFTPSASNSAGSILGGLAGAAIIASGPSWPFLISAAAALGMSPMGAAGLLALGITSLVNLLVTHVAVAQNLDTLAAKYWPQSIASYPNAPPSITPNNLNKA